MNSTKLNGSRQATGPQLPCWKGLSSDIHTQHWSRSRSSHDPAVVVAYQAEGRRRAALAAKADARRRCVMNIAFTAGMIAAFIACGYTLHREQQLLERERNVRSY